ncbi:MAG: hypothetical protein U0984_04375 [Prosthecobacter sp.]|nr:hypothetical protein [Prosthecobacter sp.]
MTPIQAINTLFYTLGVPARRLPLLDEIIRRRAAPSQRPLLDQEMSEERAQIWRAARKVVSRVVPVGHAARDRLLLAFLTLACDGDGASAQRLLPQMIRAVGLN